MLMAGEEFCTSFQIASNVLCQPLALLARRPCTQFVDLEGLAPFMACRLIALEKNPGVRPIGIGETIRHIVAKAEPLKADFRNHTQLLMIRTILLECLRN